MNEKFPVPQAEALIGYFDELDPEFFSDKVKEYATDSEGNVINDPKEVLKNIFNESSIKQYEGFEIEKSERDLEIIAIATDAVKKFAAEYGREQFVELTHDHIHFFKDGGVEEFTEGRLGIGSHATVLGEALVDRRDDLSTAITTFHELWHTLASYNAIQATTEGELTWYRSGFSIKSRDGKREMFHHLDEALVGHATKRFVYEVLRNREDFKEFIEKIEENGEVIDTTRERELTDLLKYLDIVFDRNKDAFENRDEILDMFMKAQVTGNLLPVARLIDGTFAKGYFRKLSTL